MKPLKRKYQSYYKPKPLTNEVKVHPVELKFKEAKYLSDLMSLFRDLECTYSTLLLLKEKYIAQNDTNQSQQNGKLSEEKIITRALITSALISYTRCFNKGARFNLTTDIFDYLENSDYVKSEHKFFTDLRSKHFAHSINPFEQHHIVAMVSENKFHGIANYNLFGVTNGREEGLVELTLIAMDYVKSQISVHEKIVSQKVKELSIEELTNLPKVNIKVAGLNNVKDVRK